MSFNRGLVVCGRSMLLGLALLLAPAAATWAITIDVVSASGTVSPGATIDVELRLSGLGDGAAPSVSVYDLDFSFDPALLSLDSVAYGDPVLGNQLDLQLLGSVQSTSPVVGGVQLFELSVDSPLALDSLQAGEFVLATVTLLALGPGSSPLGVAVNSLGDSGGAPLVAAANGTSVEVVPEPSTGLLVALGLSLVAHRTRRGSGRKESCSG